MSKDGGVGVEVTKFVQKNQFDDGNRQAEGKAAAWPIANRPAARPRIPKTYQILQVRTINCSPAERFQAAFWRSARKQKGGAGSNPPPPFQILSQNFNDRGTSRHTHRRRASFCSRARCTSRGTRLPCGSVPQNGISSSRSETGAGPRPPPLLAPCPPPKPPP